MPCKHFSYKDVLTLYTDFVFPCTAMSNEVHHIKKLLQKKPGQLWGIGKTRNI